MRASVEVFARRWWSGALGTPGRVMAGLAAPASWLWRGAAAWTIARRAAGAVRVDGAAVVSVGNLAVGGTGKTPFTAWIAASLRDLGLHPAVLVGGHAADEAALLGWRLPGTPVIADRDRVRAGRRAVSGGSDVLVLDDGFQHRRMRRDLDVVLLAAEDPFPGRVLPTGPYREGVEALARADVVVVTRRMAAREASHRLAEAVEERLPGRVAGGVALGGRGWTDLDGVAVPSPGGDVLAVCGVARPEGFRAAVEATVTGAVELVAFPDHHAYTARELARLATRAAGRCVVVTEKDAVKLRAHPGTMGRVHVFSEAVAWDWGEEVFLERLRGVVERGRSR